MPTSSLLARLTLALAAASASSVLVTACGDSANGGTAEGQSCQRALPKENADSSGQIRCHADTDCPDKSNTTCFPPGTSSCGNVGGARAPICANDAACVAQGSNLVCEPKHDGNAFCDAKCTDDTTCDAAFTCEAATGHCVPRSCDQTACPAETFCTAAKVCAYQRCNEKRGCQDGFTCSATFVCEPTPCPDGTDAACSATHTCNAGSKTCQRRSCSCDTECGSGYCVEGGCYTAAGTCQGACAAGRPLLDPAGEPLVALLLRGIANGW